MPVYLNPYGDLYYGTLGRDEIYGYGGNDEIYGRDGNDDIYGEMRQRLAPRRRGQ